MPQLSALQTRTKKSLNLLVTLYFARRGSTDSFAIYATIINMSDSYYPILVGVPVSISTSPYVETQRDREGSDDEKRYGDNPSRYDRVGSDNKLPLRRINRIASANDHR